MDGAKELITELSDRIGKAGNVRAVFGEPVGEGINMVIPVARVSVRGGGGGGTDQPTSRDESPGDRRTGGSGFGLGLNIVTSPVGYIEIGGGKPHFVPVVDKTRVMLGGMALIGLALWFAKAGMKLASKR